MWPQARASPLPAEAFGGCRLAFDLIYNPIQTRFLRDAAAAGCATLNGVDMFVRQAAAQFELWTRRSPDTEGVAELVDGEIRMMNQDAQSGADGSAPRNTRSGPSSK